MPEPTLLAYRGKDGCRHVLCTRDGRPDALDRCFGWHCPRCHEPCSLQGHDCTVVIDERPTREP